MIPTRTRVVDELHDVGNDLCKNGKGWILVTVGAGWFLSLGVRYMYPSLLPFFREEFDISFFTAGLLLSVLWASYSLGQFPGGVLGDQVGERVLLVFSTAISTLALIVIVASINIWMLFVGTIAFGLVTAFYGPARFTIFTRIYSERAGTAVGLTMAAGSIGSSLLPAFGATIASFWMWQLGFGVLIPIFLGVTIALWFGLPRSGSSTGHTTDGVSTKTILLTLRSVATNGIPIVVTIQIVLGFVSQAFLGFYPTYLIEVKGLSPQLAGIIFGLYFAVGIVVQPLTGMGKDRFGARATLTFVIGMYLLGLALLFVAETFVHIIILTVLLSHRNGTGVVNNTFIANSLSESIKGTGLGLLRTVWILIGATGPIFVGYLSDLGQIEYAYLVLTVLIFGALLLTVFVPKQ